MKNVKKNLLSKDNWIRVVFMLSFLIIKCIAWWVIFAIIAFQVISKLFINKLNDKLLEFSENLNTYIYQILRFLTYNTETKPFPFGAWPKKNIKTKTK